LRSSVARQREGFYSESEFSLRGIYDLRDEVVEIGRSCVHPEYRDGSVISHLWIGLGMYLRDFNARYLCGCGSIHSRDADTASRIYGYLREKEFLVEPGFEAVPHPEFRMAGFRKDYPIADLKATGKEMPPLIKGYMRAGARITGEPAYDSVFGTTDFFIIFDVDEIDKRYSRHYLENELSLKKES
jgi:putative hemolysin